jgi:hypothetical protein
MKDESSDLGTIQVLAERLNNSRLPRALELKARVDRGNVLNDNDRPDEMQGHRPAPVVGASITYRLAFGPSTGMNRSSLGWGRRR